MLAYSNGLIRGGVQGTEDNEEIYNISTCDLMSRMEVNLIKPIVLTGYLCDDDNYKSPDVSVEEISKLYHKFIRQGASVEETIQSILNYYNAILLPLKDEYPNRYKISSKVKSRTKWIY